MEACSRGWPRAAAPPIGPGGEGSFSARLERGLDSPIRPGGAKSPAGGGHPLLRVGVWLFLVLVVALTVTALIADVGRVGAMVLAVSPGWLAAIVGAVCGNYALRFVKWAWFLRRLGLIVAWRDSVWIFFSAFTMVLSPGKLGELMKSLLLRSRYGFPVARTAPIVLAERLTDLLGLVVLGLLGSSRFTTGAGGLAVLGGLLFVGGLAITRPEFWRFLDRSVVGRFPRLARFRPSLRALEASSQHLLSLPSLAMMVPLSALSWAGEGVALYCIFRALGIELPELLGLSVFAHAVSSVLGALSFLPGGLGVTEGTLGGLFVYAGVGREAAISATLLIRAVTLWFAVFLGTGVYLLGRRPGETIDRVAVHAGADPAV